MQTTLSSPPVLNSKPSGASEGADGLGVCPYLDISCGHVWPDRHDCEDDAARVSSKNPLGSPNRDITGEKYVKRGCTVRRGASLGYVCRVRDGWAYVDWMGGLKGYAIKCSNLQVLAV